MELSYRKEMVILAALTVLALIIVSNIYDYDVFSKWVIASYLLGPLHIYSAPLIFGHEFRIVYPPLAPLLFIASVVPLLLINPRLILSPTPPLPVRIAIKIPIIASYYAMYVLLRRRYGREAALLFATGVASIVGLLVYTSDMPSVLLAFLALELLDYNLALSAVLLALAVLLKQIWVIVTPLILIYVYLRYGTRNTLKLLTILAATACALVIPFIFSTNIGVILEYVLEFHAKRPPQGLNPWVLALYLTNYNADFATRVAQLWILVFTPLTFYALYRLVKNGYNRDSLILASSAVLIAFLASSKVVNPVYPLWVTPLLAALAPRYRNARQAYILVNIAAALLVAHFSLYYISAAVAHKPLFIEEEKRWINARKVEEYIIGAWPTVTKMLLKWLESSPLRMVFLKLYTWWPYIASSLAVVYVALMLSAYILVVRTIGESGWRKEGYRSIRAVVLGRAGHGEHREARAG